ncbi:MAG: TFIIB-type zinc ribbon-containing protein [Deltaproteobacteria bacterium]|nr:TFIIB-type zinc ribbon-containing protein [Deltaproteobacteria bacterium]
MRCPNCNGARSETDSVCPRCGLVFHIETDPEILDTPMVDAVHSDSDPGPFDPQAAVGTVIGVFDREKAIGTKIGVVAPRKRRLADSDEPAFSGGFLQLPESTVSRDFERFVADARVFLARMGIVGRLTLYFMSTVAIGVLFPWTDAQGVGLEPGIEQMGWLPLGLILVAGLLHVARYRKIASLRPLLALGALVFAAATLLSMGYVFRTNAAIDESMRPRLYHGYWATLLASLLSLLGSLLAMKDVTARR